MSGRSACAASQVALIAPTEVPVKIENGAPRQPCSCRISTIPAMTPVSYAPGALELSGRFGPQ